MSANRPVFRFRAASVCTLSFYLAALGGCAMFQPKPKAHVVDPTNAFYRALHFSNVGGLTTKARAARQNFLRLVGPGATIDTIETAATQQKAVCRREAGILRCTFVSILSYGKMFRRDNEYRIEVVASPRGRRAAAVAVCVDVMPNGYNPLYRSCVGDPPD